LVHTGDFGWYTTTIGELTEFLIWFEKQPAKKKIFIAGNHDLLMDRKWIAKRDPILKLIWQQMYDDARKLIPNYDVIYLENSEYVYEGVKFWGSPYSPTFGNDWAFNADRGEQIRKIWAKIPSDVNVILTHTPVYGYLDDVDNKYMKAGETDHHKGCEDLLNIIKKRLLKLKLHCGGHIHDRVGIIQAKMSNKRRVLFSNATVIANDCTQLITDPFVITI